MTLIEDVAWLKELEKKATPGRWIKAERLEYDADYETADHLVGGPTGRTEYDRDTGIFTTYNADPDEIYDDSIICRPDVEDDADFIAEFRNAAPALLDVLGAFQEGDANEIAYAIDVLRADPKYTGDPRVLRRLAVAAREMEATAMKCDRRIGTICVYLHMECPYHVQDKESECPNFWKMMQEPRP